ncbi:MAG: thioesterase [Actinomycetota bacterium]|nr:thioesterase [Actinomycetota bacterium]
MIVHPALLEIADDSPLALVPFTGGRIYRHQRTLGLADCGSDGILRFDAAARIAQDIAAADLADSGLEDEGVWVVRRTHIRFFGAPRYRETLAVSTFCAGTGRSWAQRRTTLLGEVGRVEISSLWVQTDPSSRAPKSLTSRFHEVFGPSAQNRRVGTRLELSEEKDFVVLPWQPRVTDIDILGHTNNAAYFEAIEEVARRSDMPSAASTEVFAIAEYRDGVEDGEIAEVRLAYASPDGFRLDFHAREKRQCSLAFGTKA